MKKQINPSIKAHLLWSALILLLTFNQNIFCQTPTPTSTPSPTSTAVCFRPPPGVCTSFEAESEINTLEGSAIVLSCPTCSGGAKVSYVGDNSGTLQFNAVGVVVPGAHTLTICYLNGDAVRYAYLSVNGGPGTPVSFPSTGSFQTVGSIQITVILNTGCNTLEFYNPIVGNWAPDFDRITFSCPTCALPTPTPTPAVTTNPATNVASFSATLNGTVNPNGSTTAVFFEYGPTTSYGFSTPLDSYTGTTTQNASANITGLSPNTTYHFRLVATNGGGTSVGADVIFPTLTATGRPVVSTHAATLIGSFSATLNGSLDPHGLRTTVYFQYGRTTSYGFTTSMQTQTGNTYRNISANVSGLMASTIYHFRIVATNSAGTIHGADRTFTTLSATGPPVITSNAATLIASYSATLNGSIDPHGLSTTVHFEYGTTTNYGSMTASQSHHGNTYLNVSAGISSLTANTTYHFRIVATNSAGTTYGADRTFSTLSATGPPVVTTNPATLIASHSAKLNGSLDPHGLTTIVYFQYGTTTSYGLNTSLQSKSGTTYQDVSATITGLTASTKYHFRIVATNSSGTIYGSDKTFTTP